MTGEACPAPRRAAWAALAAAVAGTVLVAHHPLARGTAGPIWDAQAVFCPHFMFLGDVTRAGRLLLWNPWSAGGSPDFAEPQLGALSPLTLAFALVSGGTEAGFRAYWLALWILGGLGTLALGRHLQAPPAWAFAAALGYAFSGVSLGHAEHTSHLASLGLLPAIVWRLDAALVRRRAGPAAQAGALLGLSGLGGYPGLVILTGLLAAAWALGRALDGTSTPSRACLALALTAGIATVVAAPTYAGLVRETAGYTDRFGGLDRTMAVEYNALHPGALATMASPLLPAMRVRGQPGLWPGTDASSTGLHTGAIVPSLAALALLGRPSARRFRLWLALLAAIFLVAAMGRALPLRGWLYDVLPPFRYFRHAVIFRDVALFLLVVLGLEGGKDLAARVDDGPAGWRRPWLLSSVVAAGALATFFSFDTTTAPAGVRRAAAAHALLSWLALPCLAGASMLRPRLGRHVPVALALVALGDAAASAAFMRPLGCRDGLGQGWRRAEAHRVRSLDLTPAGLRRYESEPRLFTDVGLGNSHLPFKYPALDTYTAFYNRFHAELVARPILRRAASGDDRVWFSERAALVPPTDFVNLSLNLMSTAFEYPVMVVHPRSQMLLPPERGRQPGDGEASAAIRGLPPARVLPSTVVEYGPDVLHLRVHPPRPGFLLVTDRFARGWRATVDGRPAEIMGGLMIYRALEVPAGPCDVRFTYRPEGHPWLLLLSWTTMAMTAAACLRRIPIRRASTRWPPAAAAPSSPP